jgi:hypothetical protein
MPTPTIDEITIADEPERWIALGFTMTDRGCRLGDVLLRFVAPTDSVPSGIVSWSLRDVQSVELDGLATTVSERPPPDAEPSAHANGVLAIDHVVAFTPAFGRTVSALQAAGLELRRVREEPTPGGAPRQAFFRLGREILELVQMPDDAMERQGGQEGPARFWGLALLVRDLDRSAQAFAPHAGEPRAAVQRGRRIATVRRSAGLSVPLALMSAAAPIGEQAA